MAPFFGNSVACRIAEAHEIKHSTLVLGDWRAAQRIEFYIGRDGGSEAGEEEGEAVAAGAGQAKQQQRRAAKGRGSSSAGKLYRGDSSSGGSEASGASSSGQVEAGMGRSVVTGVGGFKVWVVNTHLDHEHQDNRQRQVGGVLESSCAGLCIWHLYLQQASGQHLCVLPSSPTNSTCTPVIVAAAAGAGGVRVDGQGEAGLRRHHPVR